MAGLPSRHVYPVEYYSAIKRRRPLTGPAAGMDLKGISFIMLNEGGRSQMVLVATILRIITHWEKEEQSRGDGQQQIRGGQGLGVRGEHGAGRGPDFPVVGV